MAESDRDHSSEMEARLEEKHHRWLSPQELCGVLQDPNNLFSDKRAIKPPSGSIFHFDKKLLKNYKNDGYVWKKAKSGRTKEGHETLKIEGVDVLHCYYAHREDDEKFHRRSYWMTDKSLSHRVLVHYRDVKEDQIRTRKVVLPSSKTDGSAYNHQANFGSPQFLALQNDIGSVSNPSNFQNSQATGPSNLGSYENLGDTSNLGNYENVYFVPSPSNLGSYENLGDTSNLGNYENVYFVPGPSNLGSYENLGDTSNLGNYENLIFDTSDWGMPENPFIGLPDGACTNSRVSSSAAVEPSHSSLGKRPCAIEEVDEEEEEEGNYTNQARKRLKATWGQKSIATSAATNITAAPESSIPAVPHSRPTSDANPDFVQDVENQEQELEPTSIEPENGKSKAVVQNDFGTGKNHEFEGGEVMRSLEELHELLHQASAPNTPASSSISTTIDSQPIATIRTTLEMDFTTVAGDVDKISLIKRFVDSDCVPTGSRTEIWAILEMLEQPLQAYSEYDKGKNLNAQVEDMAKHLQPQAQFCKLKQSNLKRLEDEKKGIEAEQAAIRAEIYGALKETEPIRAKLEELLRQRDQFKKNEGSLNTSLVIGNGHWKTLKKAIARYLHP